MKNNLFDNFIQQKMLASKPDVPAHIWENIATKSNNKKPLGFLYSNMGRAAAVFLLLISTSIIGYVWLVKKPTATSNIVKQNNKENANNKIENNNSKNETANQPIVEKTAPTNNNISNTIIVLQNKNTATKKQKIATQLVHINIFTSEPTEQNVTETPQQPMLASNVFIAALKLNTHTFTPNFYNKKLPKGIPCPEVEKNAAANKAYFELYAGPDYAFKTFEDTGTAYIDKRIASTALQYAFSVGLRYTKVFNNGISFRTGVNYSQVNERFFAKNGYTLEHVFTVNGAGDTTSNYLLRTPVYTKTTNVYKTIDIPVQVGYEMGNGRLHVNVGAGVMVNITSKQSGSVIEPNGLAADITTGKTTSSYKYKTKAGVSFLGSATVYYKLNDKLHLLAEPFLKYGLSPVTNENITFKEKNHAAGLRVGMRMDL